MKVVKTYVLLIVLMLQSMLLSAQLYVDTDDSGRDGLRNKHGRWVLPPKYSSIWWDSQMQMWYLSLPGINGVGLVNSDGQIVIPCNYSFIQQIKSNYYQVIQEQDDVSRVGIYCGNRQIVPCQYYDISSCFFENGGLKVTDADGKVGLFDLRGKLKIPILFADILFLDDIGCWLVFDIDRRQGLYANDGTFLLDAKYSHIFPDKDDSYGPNCVEVHNLEDLRGVFNIELQDWVIPCEYSMLRYDKEYCAYEAWNDSVMGILGQDGKEVVPCIYHYVNFSGENLFAVQKEMLGKWALFGDGHELTPFEYDEAPSFKDGVALVKKDGRAQLIYNPLTNKKDVSIAQQGQNVNGRGKPQAQSRYPAPHSDVDENIPEGKNVNDKQFVFIVANENYEDAPVPYALNDGRIFYEYCKRAWAVPEQNITIYEDATLGELVALVRKMKDVAQSFDGEASVLFYYAGHGFPDEKNNSAYLLPIDGDGRQIEKTGLSLKQLYADISKIPMKNSLVILDACFSGAKREDTMLASSRGVTIRVKEDVPEGKIVVFSASQGDETAHQLEEKGHGLFTYYLLKEIQRSGGSTSLGELSDYVTKQVKRQSVVINNKKQSPTIIPSIELYDCWREIKLE